MHRPGELVDLSHSSFSWYAIGNDDCNEPPTFRFSSRDETTWFEPDDGPFLVITSAHEGRNFNFHMGDEFVCLLTKDGRVGWELYTDVCLVG